jgi:hypothetical protein
MTRFNIARLTNISDTEIHNSLLTPKFPPRTNTASTPNNTSASSPFYLSNALVIPTKPQISRCSDFIKMIITYAHSVEPKSQNAYLLLSQFHLSNATSDDSQREEILALITPWFRQNLSVPGRHRDTLKAAFSYVSWDTDQQCAGTDLQRADDLADKHLTFVIRGGRISAIGWPEDVVISHRGIMN